MASPHKQLNDDSSKALALAVIHAEEEHSNNGSCETADEPYGQPPPHHKIMSPFQSPDSMEQELLASLKHLRQIEDTSPTTTTTATTSPTSHKDSKDSLLVTTFQRMDSGDLDNILGIDTDDHKTKFAKSKGESKLKVKKESSSSSSSNKKKEESKDKSSNFSSKSPKTPLKNSPSLGAKLEQDAKLKKKDEAKNDDDDDDEDQTILTLWDMKEMFQKEHQGVEVPNDEALKQRYKPKTKKHASHHHKHHHHPRSRRSKSRHSYHRSGSSASQHSRSPSVTKGGSVQTILSQEKWGHASMDSIRMVSPHRSKRHHHHTKNHQHPQSARTPEPRISKSAPGHAKRSLTDLLQTNAQSYNNNNNSANSMSLAEILPIPFHSESTNEHGPKDVDDEDNNVEEFARDSDEESMDELAAPSMHVPCLPSPLASSSPTVTQSTILTPPNSWAPGDAKADSSHPLRTHPASAEGGVGKKSRTKTAFFKTKLRALLKGNANNDNTATGGDEKPLMLLVDVDSNSRRMDQSKSNAATAQDTSQDGPVKAIRRTLSKNKKTANPPGTSRMSNVLSNVLGRNSSSAPFGELDCPSSDDDDDDDDERFLMNSEKGHVDVTVALGSSTHGMYLDEHSHDGSTLTKEQELSKMQQEQEKVMRQVEEARIATRKIRASHRRKRNSKSPSRLVGSDHVPSKSIRDPIKPTSNSSVRSERSKSAESLSRNSRRKTESDILRKASHVTRSERRRARSIDASKHRKEGNHRRRSRSSDAGKQLGVGEVKPSDNYGRRRSRSFDAEAVRNESQSKEVKRRSTRKGPPPPPPPPRHHHHHDISKPSSASPATRRRQKAGKKKASSTPNIHSPYQTPASKLRRPSGDGGDTAMDRAVTDIKAVSDHHAHHHKISGGGGILHRREATQAIKERHKQHQATFLPEPEADPPSPDTTPKAVRRLVSIEPPKTPATTTTATGEGTQEFKMEDWVSDSDEEKAYSMDAGNGT